MAGAVKGMRTMGAARVRRRRLSAWRATASAAVAICAALVASAKVSCNQASRLTLSGNVVELIGKKPKHGKQRTRVFRLTPAHARERANGAAQLILRLPAAALAALKHGAAESVTLTLVATSTNGTTRVTDRIRLHGVM